MSDETGVIPENIPWIRLWMHANPFRLINQETGRELARPYSITFTKDIADDDRASAAAVETVAVVDSADVGMQPAYVVFA